MTRVARLNPDVWTELFLANKGALSSVLGGLIERLSDYKAALDAEDVPRLRELLDRGRAVIESMPPTHKSFARR
jgi:prephenate dehydrogenase